MKPFGDILWFEDEELVLKSTIPIFRRNDLSVYGVREPLQGLDLLRNDHYSMVLLDLRMPEMDGVEVLQNIRKFNKNIPVVLLSAFIHDLEYSDKLDEALITDKIEKPLPMETAAAFPEIMKRLQKYSLDYMADHFDPFDVPFIQYLQMSEKQARNVQRRAQSEYEMWIRRELRDRDAKWMLVCRKKILRHSRELEDFPEHEELKEIGHEHQGVPFVFFIPPQIEMTSWPHLRENTDFYPSFSVEAGNSTRMKRFVADLDTGSCHSFFDLKELERNRCLQINCHLDFPYFAKNSSGLEFLYYVKCFLVRIEDENKSQASTKMHCFTVNNWDSSPFCNMNPNRTALVGRDMLRKFPLRVILDSGKRTTTIYFNEDGINKNNARDAS